MFNPVYIDNKLLKTFKMFVLTFKHAYYAPKNVNNHSSKGFQKYCLGTSVFFYLLCDI